MNFITFSVPYEIPVNLLGMKVATCYGMENNNQVGGDFASTLVGEQEYPPKIVKTVKINKEEFLKFLGEVTISSKEGEKL